MAGQVVCGCSAGPPDHPLHLCTAALYLQTRHRVSQIVIDMSTCCASAMLGCTCAARTQLQQGV